MTFPPRNGQFVVFSVLFGGLVVISLALVALGQVIPGLLGAALFGTALVPTFRRATDKGAALDFRDDALHARTASVVVPWASVRRARHESLSAPGSGGRGFLVLELEPHATFDRQGFLAPREKESKDGGKELWITLAGVDGQPRDILIAAEERAGA